jgi:hypothetical protein
VSALARIECGARWMEGKSGGRRCAAAVAGGRGRTKVGGGADGWGRGEGDWEKGREERGPAGGGPEEMVGPELDWALC